MDILVLDKELKSVGIFDTFESLLWTDRHSSAGDFEIYTPVSREAINTLQKGFYLWIADSEHTMIVESRRIDDEIEDGDRFIVTGRSLESLLDRRIIWGQTILTGNLQNGIELLLNENVISPTDPDRAIPNFIFEVSADPNVTSLEVDAQFTRTNLYETIKALCDANYIGFKVRLSADNHFVFSLYAGVDRSYDQIANPFVIFSPKFENLIRSKFSESTKLLRTVNVVAGEGEGPTRTTIVVGSGFGIDRREMYTDARDLSRETDGGTLTEPEYLAQLEQRGLETLSEYTETQTFEGQIDSTQMFTYGEDFFMGDIVQIVNEYGMEARSRVTEVIICDNVSEKSINPTFTMVE